jgi:OOP family OmpA-OmpF porin
VTAKKIEIDEKIYFDTALTTIQERSLPVLDLVVKELAENPALRLRIEGHTDSKGVAGKNKKLSQGRADAVKAYLVDKGVAAARVEARGFGQARPIADNKTDAGREKNRRVEFVVLK